MRVTIADDAVLLRQGLVRLLTDAGHDIVGEAGDADSLLNLVGDHHPDAVIVDIRMPPTFTDEGIRAAHQIRGGFPGIGVLVLSQHVETSYAVRLLEQGAEGLGYLLKDRVADIAQVLDALERVASGGSVVDPAVVERLVGRQRVRSPLDELTAREKDVLARMAEGRSNQAIGELLFLSSKTVENHVSSIFSKLGLHQTPDDHRRVLAVLTYLRSS